MNTNFLPKWHAAKGRARSPQPGQGMVEFALILPILLVFLIGVMEFGRLLTIYNSVSNSSREAARWGVVVGMAPSGLPYWKDCAGMAASAARTAGLATLDGVSIVYEEPNPDPGAAEKFTKIGVCDSHLVSGNGVYDPGESAIFETGKTMQNGYRVRITVESSYAPIVPLLPIPKRTFTFTASRTVFTSIQGAPACNDDIDNDNDGKTDYNPVPGLGDPDCSSANDDSEQHITPTNCYALEVEIFNNILAGSTATAGNVELSPASSGGCDPGYYSYNSTVTVTALNRNGNIHDTSQPDEGWTDVSTHSGHTATVLVLSDQAVGVHFTRGNCYTLTWGVDPTSTGSGTMPLPVPAPDCGGSQYTEGTVVQLSANPAAGSMLMHWEGNHETDNPLMLLMNGNKTYLAHFIGAGACYSFGADVSPNNTGSVQVNPASNSPCTGTKRQGTVTLTALPDPFYVFSGWTGSHISSANPLIVSMTASKSLTANFTRCYQLLTFASNGSVNVYPSSSGGCPALSYASGSQVTLYPAGSPGFTFSSWAEDATGNQNPLTLTMNDDKTVTANFTASNGCYLFTRVANPGSLGEGMFPATTPGTNCITSTNLPGYRVNTDIQFSVNNSVTGYTFNYWSLPGGATATSPSATLRIGAQDTTVTANFTPNCHTLSTPASANGAISQTLVEGGGCTKNGQPGYTYNSRVRLTANPNPGYILASWSDTTLGETNPVEIPIRADSTITATFVTGCFSMSTAVGSGAGSASFTASSPTCANGRYPAGTTITTSATGGDFLNWTLPDSSVFSDRSTLQFTLTGDTTLLANFGQCYALAAAANPQTNLGGQPTGNIVQALSGNCADGTKYTPGTQVTLIAQPGTGYQFTGWSGVDTITGSQASVTMNADRTAAASFSAACYTLSRLVTPGTASNPDIFSTNSGTVAVNVVSAPNGACQAADQYTYNTQLQLTAAPTAGSNYYFSHWSGAASGAANPATLQMPAGDAIAMARFNGSCVSQSGLTAGYSESYDTGYVAVTYANYTGAMRTIDAITVDWPSGGGRKLGWIYFGSTKIVFARSNNDPFFVNSGWFTGGVRSFMDGVARQMQIYFENFTVATPGNSYTVTTHFDNGCQVSLSKTFP